MQSLHFILIVLFFISYITYALTIPIELPKRSLLTRSSLFDPHEAFESAANSTWSVFWNNTHQAFSQSDPACPNSPTTFQDAVVWSVAVAGMAIVESGDISKTNEVINSLYKYQNDKGWFAATPGNSHSYVDDNCQVLWAFLQAYGLTHNENYLTTATKLMELIQGKWSDEVGGVRWRVEGDYIASISTVEAALSAVKLYEHRNNDSSLLSFAKKCLSWSDDNLLDELDGFYYDGLNIHNKTKIDKGKLTYTVGVAISTYSYLYKYTNDEQYVTIATTKANGTLASKTFLNGHGYWNNGLRFVHLLFVGFSDLITMGDKREFIDSVWKQGQYIYENDQLSGSGYVGNYLDLSKPIEPHSTSSLHEKERHDNKDDVELNHKQKTTHNHHNDYYCNNHSKQFKRSLMDDGSAAQIFYAISRFS